MGQQYVRLERVTVPLIKAARHNLREIQRELGPGSNIDLARSHLNEILFGPSDASAVVASWSASLKEHGIEKLRKNGVRVVEIMMSLPANHRGPTKQFFLDSLEWVRSYLGGVVFSAVIHRDEGADHMHVLVLPIIEGRMRGRDYIGDIRRLQTIQMSFQAAVGQKHGLARPPPKSRLTVAQKCDTASDVVSTLIANPDLLAHPSVKAGLLEAIERDPVALAKATGVSIRSVRPRATPIRERAERSAIADCGEEMAIAVCGTEARCNNRYPVYSGLTQPQQYSGSVH